MRTVTSRVWLFDHGVSRSMRCGVTTRPLRIRSRINWWVSDNPVLLDLIAATWQRQ